MKIMELQLLITIDSYKPSPEGNGILILCLDLRYSTRNSYLVKGNSIRFSQSSFT